MIGSLGQPLLFLVALGFGFGPIYEKAGEGNYIQFLVPGIIGMSVLFMAVFSGIDLIWDKQFGFLKETLVAPVSRGNIMIGRTLGGATIATFQGVLIFFISLLIGFRPQNLLMLGLALLFVFLIAVLFAALGTIIASVLEDMQGFQLIMSFLVMPLFFLSGALFPLSGLPPAIGAIITVNPLSYGIDGLRGTLAGSAHFGLTHDLFVLCTISVIFLAIGEYLFSKIEI